MEPAANKSRKSEIEALVHLSKAIITDPKKVNAIVDILAKLEAEDIGVVIAGIHGLARVFDHFLKEGDMYLERPVTDHEHLIDRSVSEKYAIWLQDHYRNTVDRLVEFFTSEKQKVSELALCTVMKFVSLEGSRPITKIPKETLCFPAHILEKVVLGFLSDTVDTRSIVGRFQEFLDYPDVKFNTLKIMKSIVKADVSKQELTGTYLNNCFTIMKLLTFGCDDDAKEKKSTERLCTRTDIEDPARFKFDFKAAKQIFSRMWITFLKRKLPGPLYRRVLLCFDDCILSCMESPLLLTDFLLDSYNMGGVVSLLALNGLFVLMIKYNLEFPDFYKNLYALFKPDIFYTKYRARFFFLADIFLSSTHLTEYLVAAFAKRLSRISLMAPPHCLLLVMPFIQNLLMRHQGLMKLIHNPNGVKSLISDPYLPEEPDPMKCKAADSSLWEIKTLQAHYFPRVGKAANFIEKSLPKIENDLSEILELSSSEMFKEETEKKIKKEIALTFQRPTSLLCEKSELWTL